MHRLAEAGTTVFSRLLEVELWEVIFNLALRERHSRKDLRHIRYDNRIRKRAARLLSQAQTGWEELLDTLAWQRVEIDEVAPDVPKLMKDYGLQTPHPVVPERLTQWCANVSPSGARTPHPVARERITR